MHHHTAAANFDFVETFLVVGHPERVRSVSLMLLFAKRTRKKEHTTPNLDFVELLDATL